MAKRIENHEDWKLVVFYDEEMPVDPPITSVGQIERGLAEVERLAAAGQLRAAFLIGWGAFEAAARGLEREGASLSRPPSALTLAEYLERNGLLDDEESGSLRALVATRNAAVHGDLSRLIGDAEVQTLLAIANRLLDELKQPVTSMN